MIWIECTNLWKFNVIFNWTTTVECFEVQKRGSYFHLDVLVNITCTNIQDFRWAIGRPFRIWLMWGCWDGEVIEGDDGTGGEEGLVRAKDDDDEGPWDTEDVQGDEGDVDYVMGESGIVTTGILRGVRLGRCCFRAEALGVIVRSRICTLELYFSMPHRFLQECIHSTGFQWNGTGILWNGPVFHQILTEGTCISACKCECVYINRLL